MVIVMEKDFLYHYTSIESLAYILKNKTLRFNNLMNVDDPEEAETSDLGKFGRHCLVSCWTDISEDILPMWNMYTPDMKGVRIGMRKNPFKENIYNTGEYYFLEATKSYINYNSDYARKVSIAAQCPLLIQVEYTEDESLLKPRVLSQTESGYKIVLDEIGKYKRECWAFQKEYRYKITTAPWSTDEIHNVKSTEEHIALFNRFLDKNNEQFLNDIFLELADDAFDGMEILLGPKTSEAERIIVEALLHKYCSYGAVMIGKSRIKVR